MLQRELSQLGQQGIAGPPTAGAAEGGMGKGFGGFGPSQSFGNPGGLSGGRIASNLLTVAQAPFLFGQGGIGIGEAGPLPIPGLGGARDLISFVTSLFDDGGDDREPKRRHRRTTHEAYVRFIGFRGDFVPGQTSPVSRPEVKRKQQRDPDGPIPGTTYGNYCGGGWTGGLTPHQAGPPAPPIDKLDQCCKGHDDCWGRAKSLCDEQECNFDLWLCAGGAGHLKPFAQFYRFGISTLFGPSGVFNEGYPESCGR